MDIKWDEHGISFDGNKKAKIVTFISLLCNKCMGANEVKKIIDDKE